MKIWKRRPKGVPRKARGNAAWEQAYRDLYAARDEMDRWNMRLRLSADILFTPDQCVEKILQAREAEIDALWRLGWDDHAERKAADLAMRKETWRARPCPVGYGTGPHVDPDSGRYGPQA